MKRSPISSSGGANSGDDGAETPCARCEHPPPGRFRVRVRNLLETYEETVSFYTPDVCFADARKYIPSISEKRRIDPSPGMLVLDHLSRLVEIVDRSLYQEYETSARERMISRDEEDWPVVATALFLRSPVWTKIETSLVVEYQLGLARPSNCIYGTRKAATTLPQSR